MNTRIGRFEDGFLNRLDRPGYGLEVDETYIEELAKAGRLELRL
jgi:L-alanine-DL-glutamate epimerase-like enolase superfamily enzyme